jgi:hypothetical protein
VIHAVITPQTKKTQTPNQAGSQSHRQPKNANQREHFVPHQSASIYLRKHQSFTLLSVRGQENKKKRELFVYSYARLSSSEQGRIIHKSEINPLAVLKRRSDRLKYRVIHFHQTSHSSTTKFRMDTF